MHTHNGMMPTCPHTLCAHFHSAPPRSACPNLGSMNERAYMCLSQYAPSPLSCTTAIRCRPSPPRVGLALAQTCSAATPDSPSDHAHGIGSIRWLLKNVSTKLHNLRGGNVELQRARCRSIGIDSLFQGATTNASTQAQSYTRDTWCVKLHNCTVVSSSPRPL